MAEARGSGATAIKLYANLSGPLVAAITNEAHGQGLPVWAHAAMRGGATARDVVSAGVDVVSHATLIARESQLDSLLADMRDTMRAEDGAGLAAPQIGVGLRVVIFGVERNPRYPDADPVPYTELINPVLTPLSDEMEEGWEGCLSVPGLRGVVPRYRRLRYRAYQHHSPLQLLRNVARTKLFQR